MKKRGSFSRVSGVAGSYLFVALLLFAGCDGGGGGEGGDTPAPEDAGHGHAHEVGAHGGEVLALGNGEVHVEFVLDDSLSRIDLYLLEGDCVTPLEIADAPSINARTAEGPKQIVTAPAAGASPASHFTATDPAFAPQILNVVSLWDDIYDSWVRDSALAP